MTYTDKSHSLVIENTCCDNFFTEQGIHKSHKKTSYGPKHRKATIMAHSYCGKGLLYFYNLIFVGISASVMYLAILYVRKWGDYSMLAAGTYSIVPAGLIFLYGIFVLITGE